MQETIETPTIEETTTPIEIPTEVPAVAKNGKLAKPTACKVCKKKFNYRQSLTSHFRKTGHGGLGGAKAKTSKTTWGPVHKVGTGLTKPVTNPKTERITTKMVFRGIMPTTEDMLDEMIPSIKNVLDDLIVKRDAINNMIGMLSLYIR